MESFSSSSSDGSNDFEANQPSHGENRTLGAIPTLQGSPLEVMPQNPLIMNTAYPQSAVPTLQSSAAVFGTQAHFPLPTGESSAQGGLFPSIHSEQQMNLDGGDQLGVPLHSHFGSQAIGMPSHSTALSTINQPLRNYGNTPAYSLPTSNLPPEFRLESSSRVQLPQMDHLYSQVPIPNQSGGSPILRPQWTNWNPQNQSNWNRHNQSNWNPQNQSTMNEPLANPFGSQELPFQTPLGQAVGTSTNFYPNTGTPYQSQYLNMPFQQATGAFNSASRASYQLDGSSSNSSKMANWPAQNQGNQGLDRLTPMPNASSSRMPIKSSLYDPMYEAMGLPVDPHLRMFLARHMSGNE